MAQQGPKLFVALESLPGGGKTRFMKRILPMLHHVQGISQPLDSWFDVCHGGQVSDTGVPFNPNIFKLAMEQPERWCYSFQVWCLLTRFRAFQEFQQKSTKAPRIVMTERSWVTDKVFADFMYENGKMTEAEHSMYEYVWQWVVKEAPAYQGHIFLEEPVNILMNRIRHRMRAGEEVLDFPYVVKLQKKFDEMYDMLDDQGIPVLRINPVDYFEVKHRAILVTGHVLYFLGEVIDHGYEDKELAKEMKKGLPTEADILEAWYDMPQKEKLIQGIERTEIEDPEAYNKDPMWGKEATLKEWTEHFKRAWFKDLYADEGYQRKPKNDRYPWEPEEEPRA